jgi:Ca2+-binding EF-hand superfamily protein
MKGIGIFSVVFIVLTSTVLTSHSAGPSDERIRSAYRLILSQADTNKDGKLSVSECKAVYKDPAMADKNCKFWDADNDGVITEDEYVKQGMSFGKKK